MPDKFYQIQGFLIKAICFKFSYQKIVSSEMKAFFIDNLILQAFFYIYRMFHRFAQENINWGSVNIDQV